MTYLVASRTREFGVRLALGAGRADILTIVLRPGLWLSTVGLLWGVLIAFAATRAVRGLVFGAGDDPRVIGAEMALLLTTVALIASYFPARRATQSDPMVALRAE